MTRRVVLVDRDGVINQDRADAVTSLSQLSLIAGSPEALGALHRAGYEVVVVTNQACVGRGELTPEGLGAIHGAVARAVTEAGGRIARFYVCMHRAEEGCACRKPRPGLLQQARRELGFRPEDTWFVGDAVTDLQAARAAGCRPALVLTGKGRHSRHLVGDDVPVHRDLAAFARALLSAPPGRLVSSRT